MAAVEPFQIFPTCLWKLNYGLCTLACGKKCHKGQLNAERCLHMVVTQNRPCLHIVFTKVSVSSIISLLNKLFGLCLTHCDQPRLQATQGYLRMHLYSLRTLSLKGCDYLLTGLVKLALLEADAARARTSLRAGATLCSEAAAAVTMGSSLDSMQCRADRTQTTIDAFQLRMHELCLCWPVLRE